MDMAFQPFLEVLAHVVDPGFGAGRRGRVLRGRGDSQIVTLLRAGLAFPFLAAGVFFAFVGDSLVNLGIGIQGQP
jgi:hypothetical protein